MKNKAIRTITQESYEDMFLTKLCERIVYKGTMDSLLELFKKTSFPQYFYGFGIVIYQLGGRTIRKIEYRKSNFENIANAIVALDPIDFDMHRIQIDFILDEPEYCTFNDLSQTALNQNRFEIGVHGLAFGNKDNLEWFLPGDAFVYSIHSLKQLNSFLTNRYGIKFQQTKIFKFRSSSLINSKKLWIPLYRGYPILNNLKSPNYIELADAGINFLLRTQKKNGQFVYYYDGATDSFRDHEHPNRDLKKKPYYNALRHMSGIILLLEKFNINKNRTLLPFIKKGIEYMLEQCQTNTSKLEQPVAYIYYNNKVKLGANGLLLYILCKVKDLGIIDSSEKWAKRVATHIIDMIQPTGEFYYYYYYLDKPVSLAENQKLFSFYYPGEALLGLVAYYKLLRNKSEKQMLAEKIQLALFFLIEVRPIKYSWHYRELPLDSWLMTSIKDIRDIPELWQDSYSAYVFTEADKMLQKMYNSSNALFPDYEGAFFYKYGENPIHDGARSEGIIAAYELAFMLSNKQKIKQYFKALEIICKALSLLCNTKDSVYSLPNPDYAMGGIRFKLTRQWFRVDTIFHVANCFLKFANFDKPEHQAIVV